MLDANLISEADLHLVHLTDSVDDAVDQICAFCTRYDSMRYVGQRLIIRLSEEIDDALLAAINAEFGDIMVKGTIERTATTASEIEDRDKIDLPRLALHFNKSCFSRLRVLIDCLNGR